MSRCGRSPSLPPHGLRPARWHIAPTGIMSAAETRGIRFQPDETPAPALSLGLGLQIVILSLAGIILIPTIVMRAGGASESYLSWGGVRNGRDLRRYNDPARNPDLANRHRPPGRYGSHRGSTSPSCITAVAEGGPALMADPGCCLVRASSRAGRADAAVPAAADTDAFGNGPDVDPRDGNACRVRSPDR